MSSNKVNMMTSFIFKMKLIEEKLFSIVCYWNSFVSFSMAYMLLVLSKEEFISLDIKVFKCISNNLYVNWASKEEMKYKSIVIGRQRLYLYTFLIFYYSQNVFLFCRYITNKKNDIFWLKTSHNSVIGCVIES